MKKRIFTIFMMKLPALLFVCLFFTVISLSAQITVSGCSTIIYNGDYSPNAALTACLGCTSYEKSGGGVFLYRYNAGSNNLWVGSESVIDCANLNFALQNGETDCDPSNGGTMLNGCTIGTLPVELMWFKAKEVNKTTVQLSWEVASEVNNEGFAIERSMDGKSFEEIGFVGGRGDASDALEYTYDDDDLAKGQVYYYRLKQMDFNGRFEYFNIVSIVLENDKPVLGGFYPNPSSGLTTIDLFTIQDKRWTVQVFDLSGRAIWSSLYYFKEGKNIIELNFSVFENGLYLIKFENDLGRIYRKLFVQKQ